MKEVNTYAELLEALRVMTPEQLAQPIQVANPGPLCDEPIELMPGIAIGTVDEMGFYRCRSIVDNKYHADEVVILIDGNPFGKDGVIAFEWVGKDPDAIEERPIYGKDGPTKIEDQTTPAKPIGVDDENDMTQATVASLKWMTGIGSRIEGF